MGTAVPLYSQTDPTSSPLVVQPPKGKGVGAETASFQNLCATILRAALPAEFKARGVELPATDVDSVAESLAHQVATMLATHQTNPSSIKSEWITTQEAANRCGFSRPFVVALLDSGHYLGEVRRTAGGHRKVLASEFETLVLKASAHAPKTLAQARKAVDVTQLDAGQEIPSRNARKQSQARMQALAKTMGIDV